MRVTTARAPHAHWSSVGGAGAAGGAGAGGGAGGARAPFSATDSASHAPRSAMTPTNLAIVGKMCTGKTTLGNAVRDLAPRGVYVKLSFATRIKQLATELFDMPPTRKDRPLLCWLGAAMRARDPDVWTRCLQKTIAAFNERGVAVIVDDCRFVRELEMLKALGFIVVKCEAAPSIVLGRLRALYPADWMDHCAKMDSPSECDLDDVAATDYDYVADEALESNQHAFAVLDILVQHDHVLRQEVVCV